MDEIAEPGLKLSLCTLGMAKTNKEKFSRDRIKILYLSLKKSAV